MDGMPKATCSDSGTPQMVISIKNPHVRFWLITILLLYHVWESKNTHNSTRTSSKLSNMSSYEVHVLYNGYSRKEGCNMVANGSCTLVKGKKNVIVDTMTPWDKCKILTGLNKHGVGCDDIDYVVCTHGHSDHTGNNNLFLKATHIVGFCVSFEDSYTMHPFDTGEPYIIDEDLKVIPTPGHMYEHVSVLVNTKDKGLVAIAGDLFEREEDISNPLIWKYEVGSEDPERQEENRNKILQTADWIVPGHGPMFKVTKEMRDGAK